MIKIGVMRDRNSPFATLKKVAVVDRDVIRPFFFQGVQHVYFAKVMLTVSLNGNPMIKLIMHRDEIHKKNRTMF